MPTFDIQYGAATTRVIVAPGSLERIGPELARVLPESPLKVLVVTDNIVAPRYADRVTASLREAGLDQKLLVLPAGDATKSLAHAESVYNALADFGLARDGLLLALGGGVVSDLTGFVAATWMRGVAFAICPTTLEADIDAAIGGKTAVNHPAGKNLIGAFHQPALVHIDPICLRTLVPRDVVAGMAESIKHAVIRDEAFLAWHETHREPILSLDPATLTELIERNVRIKADIVSRDERESATAWAGRVSLNFGHTIGHAIEAASSYALRHGECVALGMTAACRISVSMGLLDQASADRVIRCIESYGLPIVLSDPPPPDELLRYIARDKKVAAGRVRFVLLDGLGNTILRNDVPERTVLDACEALARS